MLKTLSFELPQTTMKMLKFLSIRIILTSICCVLFWQCSPKPDTGNGTTDTTQVEVPKLNKVNFFLDASVSMRGYLNSSNFQAVVNDFLVKGNDSTNIWLASNTLTKFPGTKRDFMEGMLNVNLVKAKSSVMSTIFESVSRKADSNSISVLISDCILSMPNEMIKSDRNVNLIAKDGQLKSEVHDIFSKLKTKGNGAVLFAYYSNFNGTYWDYQNTPTKSVKETRPFYIWMVGKNELLQEFSKKVYNELTKKPEQILEFGIYPTMFKYSIFKSLNKKEGWELVDQNIIEITDDEAVELTIGIDLKYLPKELQNVDSLKKRLLIDTQNTAITKLINVQIKEDYSKIEPLDQEAYSKSTHIITISIDKQSTGDTQLILRLPARYSNWYQGWSNDSDISPKDRDSTTFAFASLVTGVTEVFNDDFFNVKIPIKKNN